LRSYSGTSQHFVYPEGSLPSLYDPSTGPYPEPDQSSPDHFILRPILTDPHSLQAVLVIRNMNLRPLLNLIFILKNMNPEKKKRSHADD
jgi:hypothetical protein